MLDPERTLLEKRARLEEILEVLSRQGLLYDALESGPDWLASIRLPKPEAAVLAQPLAQRLSQAATELGPTFIKIGQILGTRPDVVGPQTAAALAGLEADVPAEPFEMVRAQVTKELGMELEEAFATFDQTPVGAASVGQVHAATLADGTPVVVKVLRTGIESVIADDLAILNALAILASRRSAIRRYRPVQVMAELSHSLTQELDLNREAANLARFIHNFANQPLVDFPHPIPGRCTQRVLTETQLAGRPLSRSMADLTDQAKLAFVELGVRVYLDMIFRDNLFHGDPHAGNLFYGPPTPTSSLDPQDEGGQPTTSPPGQPPQASDEAAAQDHLGIIDFGEVGRLDPDVLDHFEVIILSIVGHDSDRLIDTMLELTNAPADVDRVGFRRDVNDWVDDYVGAGAASTDMSGAISALMAILRTYDLMLPPDMALLVKALLQLQGLLVATGLKVKLFDYIAPYSRQILRQRLSPSRLARGAGATARGWGKLLENTPEDVEQIIAAVRRGELQLPLNLTGTDRPVNRLVAAVIIAAALRGSSQMWANRAEPVAAGISLPGAVGTAVSVAAALRLLRALVRSGGL